MTGPLTALHWRWQRLGGSRLLHLVPAHPGPLSRTACGRYAVDGLQIETPLGLIELAHCEACRKRDGATA